MLIKIVLVLVFIGLPLLFLFGTIIYTQYVCVKYLRDKKN